MIKLSDELYIPGMGEVLAERERQRRTAKRPQKRQYSAAASTRRQADWSTQPESANTILIRDLKSSRARAREMRRNAPHFKRFSTLAKSNVIGSTGINLQVRAYKNDGNLKQNVNAIVEEAFWKWSFAENCSISRKYDWVAAERLFLEYLIRDGEVLVQHIEDADNPFGYAIKFISPDYLDEAYNEDLSNGNRIIMSVEVDPDYRPVAYHLTTPSSELNYSRRRYSERPVRVPADEIIHAFELDEDETQTRGITSYAASLLHGKNLHEYTGNVVEQSRVQAAVFGFMESEIAEENEYTGPENEDGNIGDLNINIAPLSINTPPPGYKFNQFDPKQPQQNHAEFKKSMLMDVAAGLGVNYFNLAGDMGAVNYSSGRVGLNEERDGTWRPLQNFVASKFCRPVYHRWLKNALLNGQVTLSARDYMEAQNPNWQPRGWQYVDPQKEIGASVEALKNNLTTLTKTLAEKGIDRTEHFKEIKAEREEAATYGVALVYDQPTAAAPPTEPETDEDEPTPAGETDDAARGYTNGGIVHLN